MSQTLAKSILERGAAFLQNEDILKRMDEQTRNDIANGKKEFYAADFYMRKKIPGFAGIIDLIQAQDVLKAGVTNLDKGRLPAFSYLALTSVGLGYGFNSSAVTNIPDEIRFASSEYLNIIPTKIFNSEFTILNDDKRILNCRTKKFFANAYADFAGEANEENAVVLPQPKLIDHRKIVRAYIEFPANAQAVPVGSHYLEIRLQGVFVGDRM